MRWWKQLGDLLYGRKTQWLLGCILIICPPLLQSRCLQVFGHIPLLQLWGKLKREFPPQCPEVQLSQQWNPAGPYQWQKPGHDRWGGVSIYQGKRGRQTICWVPITHSWLAVREENTMVAWVHLNNMPAFAAKQVFASFWSHTPTATLRETKKGISSTMSWSAA